MSSFNQFAAMQPIQNDQYMSENALETYGIDSYPQNEQMVQLTQPPTVTYYPNISNYIQNKDSYQQNNFTNATLPQQSQYNHDNSLEQRNITNVPPPLQVFNLSRNTPSQQDRFQVYNDTTRSMVSSWQNTGTGTGIQQMEQVEQRPNVPNMQSEPMVIQNQPSNGNDPFQRHNGVTRSAPHTNTLITGNGIQQNGIQQMGQVDQLSQQNQSSTSNNATNNNGIPIFDTENSIDIISQLSHQYPQINKQLQLNGMQILYSLIRETPQWTPTIMSIQQQLKQKQNHKHSKKSKKHKKKKYKRRKRYSDDSDSDSDSDSDNDSDSDSDSDSDIDSDDAKTEARWIKKAKVDVKRKHRKHIRARNTILNVVIQRVCGFEIPENIRNNWFNQTVKSMNDVIDEYSGIDKTKIKTPKKTYKKYSKTVHSYFNKTCFRWTVKWWLMVSQYINQIFPDDNERKAFGASVIRAEAKLVKAQKFQPFFAASTLNGTKEIKETVLLRNELDLIFSGCNLGISDLYNNHKKRSDSVYLELILTKLDEILGKTRTTTIIIGDSKIQWPSNYNSLIPVLIPPLPLPLPLPLPILRSDFESPTTTPIISLDKTNLQTNNINYTANNHNVISAMPPLSLGLSSFGPVHSPTYSVGEQRYSPLRNLYDMNYNQHTNTNI